MEVFSNNLVGLIIFERNLTTGKEESSACTGIRIDETRLVTTEHCVQRNDHPPKFTVSKVKVFSTESMPVETTENNFSIFYPHLKNNFVPEKL